jgi:hypothetical protein
MFLVRHVARETVTPAKVVFDALAIGLVRQLLANLREIILTTGIVNVG